MGKDNKYQEEVKTREEMGSSGMLSLLSFILLCGEVLLKLLLESFIKGFNANQRSLFLFPSKPEDAREPILPEQTP